MKKVELSLTERQRIYVREGGFSTYSESFTHEDLDEIGIPRWIEYDENQMRPLQENDKDSGGFGF